MTTHARRHHPAAVEALLWLAWTATRYSGLGALVRGIAHVAAHAAIRLGRSVLDNRALYRAGSGLAQRWRTATRAAGVWLIRQRLHLAARMPASSQPYSVTGRAGRVAVALWWVALFAVLTLPVLMR